MLNPIDTDAVIRDGGAVGRFPGEVHEGVAWWLGACLVVTQQARRIVVAHDGHPAIVEFASRLCRGAANAQHYACNVRFLGHQTEERLMDTLKILEAVPGAWLSASDDVVLIVRITLYDHHGHALSETNGLAEIRRMIAEDHVPVPVNDQARGTIEPWHQELNQREGLS
ncbi:hypothetical protein HUT19_14100 [Streptomyces sp. NA02950]|uniref:hypothetical protein n=1 Tax=Streptomyces sp. NA02950 TaxID=2742137 RepID=UPI001591D5A2|nr:hypothetical protein [Streptomyces sp. NA02950]QKV92746.1 hypothetical protein HUT19_14100 [Streptomyces sp. NA02950]